MNVRDYGHWAIHVGDCRDVLATMPAESVDSIVTDPPYGLTAARPGGRSPATEGAVMKGFMGLTWDRGVPDVDVWRECLRVLKPGGYLLAFFGTRTYHRGVVPVEDAGFEIRDQIGWVFGSGFPKSHNGPWGGTALKPAWEPIVVARKPLTGTVEQNWQQYGVGALNIDACRVPTTDSLGGGAEAETRRDQKGNAGWERPWMDDPAAREAHAARVRKNVERAEALGRWPANLIHDGSDEVMAAFPQAPGQIADASSSSSSRKNQNVYGTMARGNKGAVARLDEGSAARFFYCAKASRKDRNEGCEGMPTRDLNWSSGTQSPGTFQSENTVRAVENFHPTVKPTDLMRYLCRLVTPPGGLVLDPFMGSGSTGKAAGLEGFRFVGIDLEAAYADIAERRIATALYGEGFFG